MFFNFLNSFFKKIVEVELVKKIKFKTLKWSKLYQFESILSSLKIGF